MAVYYQDVMGEKIIFSPITSLKCSGLNVPISYLLIIMYFIYHSYSN